MIERVVTVTGTAVRRPANLLVPVGTSLAEVLDHCGGLHPDTHQVILGGPMMGQAQKDLEAPILKGTSGLLAMREPFARVEEQACIRCGRCLEACPMFLNPSQLGLLAKQELYEDMLADYHLMDCFECGSCSYVCPSHIPLVQYFRLAKKMLRKTARPA